MCVVRTPGREDLVHWTTEVCTLLSAFSARDSCQEGTWHLHGFPKSLVSFQDGLDAPGGQEGLVWLQVHSRPSPGWINLQRLDYFPSRTSPLLFSSLLPCLWEEDGFIQVLDASKSYHKLDVSETGIGCSVLHPLLAELGLCPFHHDVALGLNWNH